MSLQSILVLTTRTMHWFLKRGIVQVVQVNPDWPPEARKRKRKYSKYHGDRKSRVLVKKLG